jgi:hypothetical protein
MRGWLGFCSSLVVALVATACTAPARSPASESGPLLAPERAETIARKAALVIRDGLAREDFATVAAYVTERVCLQAQKGGRCRWMSKADLRTCTTRKTREEWQVDTGADDYPRLTCLEAFRQTFFSNPGLIVVQPTFNLFRPRADNNASSVISDEAPGDIYVELFADEAEVGNQWYPWQSLWLVFQSQGDKVQLVALQSHYWGI